MGRKSLSERELVDAFFTEFRRCWRERYSTRYVDPIGKRHRDFVARLLQEGVQPSEVLGMPEAFLRDEDGWLLEHRHPLNYLIKYPTRYLGDEAKGGRGDGKAAWGGYGYDAVGAGSADTEEAKAARRRKELAAFDRHFGQ